MSKEIAADYFSRHTGNKCFITSDNRVFHNSGSAQSFATGLKDQTIVSFTREEATAPTVEEKKYTVEDVKAFDASTAEYKDAVALAKAFSLETPSNKKEDVYEAIEKLKTALTLEIKE